MDTLTKEQIEAMPAGRDMDKLIALQVMGYTMYHYDKDVAEMCYYMLLDAEGDAVVFRANYREGEHATEEKAWADCPAFSADIAAAWQVVDKLRADGYGHGHTLPSPLPAHFDPLPRWALISWTFYKPDHKTGYNRAETTPLAICRAALLATPVSSVPAVLATV